MCLVVFAWHSHADYKLVLAANRDEFHERPAQDLDWWPDRPAILAGRDLQAGGTWLAAGKTGRFATVTNYRERQTPHSKAKSRGELVAEFVAGSDPARAHLAAIDGSKYAGFSLLGADRDTLFYVSNRGDELTELDAGVYGLSNASLDTPWPKLLRTRDALSQMLAAGAVDESALLRLLADREPARVADIDAGDLPFEFARAVSAPFITTERYGTRCTSVLLWDYEDRISLAEMRFDSAGNPSGESRFSFTAEQETCPNIS